MSAIQSTSIYYSLVPKGCAKIDVSAQTSRRRRHVPKSCECVHPSSDHRCAAPRLRAVWVLLIATALSPCSTFWRHHTCHSLSKLFLWTFISRLFLFKRTCNQSSFVAIHQHIVDVLVVDDVLLLARVVGVDSEMQSPSLWIISQQCTNSAAPGNCWN